MLRYAVRGIIAGAAGTVALNVATYADMALRGRPSSETPAKVAGTITKGLGLDLAAGANPADKQAAQAKAQHRKQGLGALQGYAVGLGIGALYGLLRSRTRLPRLLAGAGVGLAAMAASDVPAITLGGSDPRTWGFSGWAADLVPHLAYGLVTMAAYEQLMR